MKESGPTGPAAWLADLRHAGRGLGREPGFVAAVVGSLGLGIGITVAILSGANAVLLRPPPYERPDRLAYVWNRLDGFESNRLPLSGVQVETLRSERSVFEDVAGVWATTRTVSLTERSLLVASGTITPNFFDLLGIAPLLGPGFSEDEGADGENSILVSHAFWQGELGGDEDIVGQTIRVEGAPATIMGVLPPDMRLVFPQDVGVPSRIDLFQVYPWVAASNTTGPRFLRGVARLRPDVALETADRAARGVSGRLRDQFEHMAALGDLFHVVPLRDDATRRVRPLLLALVSGAVVFLLLTCVNVTSLLASRRAGRGHELALRRCLGATQYGVLRLLLAELAVLASAGVVVGMVVGAFGLEILWRLRPAALSGVVDVGLDLRVVIAAVGAVAVIGAVTVVGPLLSLRVPEGVTALRSGRVIGGGSATTRRAAVVVELALGMVLVVGAGLLGGSLRQMRSVDLGFSAESVSTFRVGISNRTFPEDAERARLADEVRAAVADLPGVDEVGATSHIPMADWANWLGSAPPVSNAAEEVGQLQFDHRSVTPGYFAAIGATMLEGRSFGPQDTGDGGPVVIVDAAYARRVFPSVESVVGREVVPTRYLDGRFVPRTATIIGVVRSMRDHDPTLPPVGQLFWPYAQSPRWELTYAVRHDTFGPDWPERIRETVSSVHGDLAVADIVPLQAYIDEASASLRFASLLGGLFSTLAVTLGFLGLYSVVTYSTRQRVGEIGIRIALGARGHNVFGDVLREGARLAATGVGIGLLGAVLTTRYLEALLFEVDPLDVRFLLAVSLGLFTIAWAATALPAVRATRVDPSTTLAP